MLELCQNRRAKGALGLFGIHYVGKASGLWGFLESESLLRAGVVLGSRPLTLNPNLLYREPQWALIIRIGFGVYCTLIIMRNPRNTRGNFNS